MDDLDYRLIALLREDARAPVSGLAQRLKVSRATVQARIDRMIARGDIAGFTVRVRPEAEARRVRAVMMVAIEGERSAAYEKINQEIMEQDLPGLAISHSPPALVVSDKVKGLVPSPLTAETFSSVTVSK